MARLAKSMQARTESLPVQATLMLISTLTVMAGATISPALPAMRSHFQAVPNADYWVRLALTLPALFIALGAPFVGIIIDRLGRKPLLVASLVLYGVAGSSGYVLDTLGVILIGRALLGISVAGIMTIATTLIADYYTGTTRAQFLGLQAGFMGLGGVVFLTLGGFLADGNWRSPFLIYLTALLLVPFTVAFLPEPQRSDAITSTTATATAPPLPIRQIAITYGIAVLTQIVFYLIPVQLPFYLKELVNASPSQSGLAIALTTLFSAASSILYRQVQSRTSFAVLYGLSFVHLALGYALIGWAVSYAILLIGLAIAGIGLGLLMPNLNLSLASMTPAAFRGRVLSGVTTSIFLGQFLSPLVSQPISQVIGLGATYELAAALMLVMTAITAGVIWRRQ